MTDIQLFTKLSELPPDLKHEVVQLNYKSSKESLAQPKRVPGKAKGLIEMKDNFDDPIPGFNE